MKQFINIGSLDLALPNEVFSDIEQALVERLKDKNSQVRTAACQLVPYFQGVPDILKGALFLLNHDAHKESRRLLTKILTVTDETLVDLAVNLQDKEDSVRFAAFERFSQLDFALLPETIRQRFVACGFRDRSDDIRNLVKSFVKEYIQGHGSTVIEFLTLVGIDRLPEKYESGVLRATRFLITEVTRTDALKQQVQALTKKLITSIRNPRKINAPTQADLLILRIGMENLKESDPTLVPDVDILCNAVTKYAASPDVFKTHQVILLALCSDLGEPVVIHKLSECLRQVLVEVVVNIEDLTDHEEEINVKYRAMRVEDCFINTPEQYISEIIRILHTLSTGYENEFTRSMIETINDIRDPMMAAEALEDEDEEQQQTLLEKRTQLQATVDQLNEEIETVQAEKQTKKTQKILEDLIKQSDMQESQVKGIDDDITELLVRALTVANELLRYCEMGHITPEIHELLGTLIWPSLKFSNEPVRSLALECLAKFCLLDLEPCKRYLFVFQAILEQERNCLGDFISIGACCDFFSVYDILKQEADNRMEEEGSVTGHAVLNTIISYLESPIPKIKAMAVEGLTKLLLMNRVPHCESIVARLMLCFFEPEGTPEVKQCLHVFFTYYSSLSQSNCNYLTISSKLVLGLFADYIKNLESKSQSRMDFRHLCLKKIFTFVFCYTSPLYLAEHGKFEVTSSSHLDLYYYLTLSLMRNQYSPTIFEIYSKLLTSVDFSGASVAEVCLAKKLVKKLYRTTTSDTKYAKSLKHLEKVLNELAEIKKHYGNSIQDTFLYETVKNRYELDTAAVNKFVSRLNEYGSSNLYTPLKAEIDELDPVEESGEEDLRPKNLEQEVFEVKPEITEKKNRKVKNESPAKQKVLSKEPTKRKLRSDSPPTRKLRPRR